MPLFFYDGNPSPTSYRATGSGVLVRLGKRFFILTAGHCARETRRLTVFAAITSERHLFRVSVVHADLIADAEGGLDLGAVELAPDTATSMEAQEKVFAGTRRLVVLTRAEHSETSDLYTVAGFPSEISEDLGDGRPGVAARFFYVTSAQRPVAQAGSALPAVAATPESCLDIWMNDDDAVEVESSEAVTLPALSGASGGGCWKTFSRPAPEGGWSPELVRLAGTHFATVKRSAGGFNYMTARQCLVGYHLDLIARGWPDLRHLIHAEWPAVARDEFATSPRSA